MSFKVTIKNFGKLTDATIRIGKFTVFAGSNNTGKSFVSKALYSIFSAMNENHVKALLEPHLAPLHSSLRRLGSISKDEHLRAMSDKVANLRKQINDISPNNDANELDIVEEMFPSVYSSLKEIQDALPELKTVAESFIKSRQNEDNGGENFERARHISFFSRDIERMIERMGRQINHLREIMEFSAGTLVAQGFSRKIEENFTQNFQVELLSDLVGGGQDSAVFNIPDIVNIQIGAAMQWNVNWSGMHKMQQYSHVLYLESPSFWKIKNALEYIRPRMQDSTGIPKYVYDMFDALRLSYPTTADADTIGRDILDNLTSSIGGKLKVGETGDLFFDDGKGSYPLSLAAMGIANLGMLALLIEKNLLDKNTFLFVDEPEAHLHPAWQVEMAEALFALAKGGVNVVIATHSADILKWLEVRI